MRRFFLLPVDMGFVPEMKRLNSWKNSSPGSGEGPGEEFF
jgi:hypothetical protein